MDIDGQRFKRDVLFCYDLKLPEDFVPKNEGKYDYLYFLSASLLDTIYIISVFK